MNLTTRLLQASVLAWLVLSISAVKHSGSIRHRSLSSDAIKVRCQALANQTTLGDVSFVVEAACDVETAVMDGCVPNTPCQICYKTKTERNAFLISCDVLNDWQAQALESLAQPQEQSQPHGIVLSSALTASEMEIQTTSSTDNTHSSASTSSKATAALSSSAEAVAAIGVALVVLIGGVFVIKQHRQRRLEEEALGTPRDCGGVLVSVQSRTQIATI